MASALYYAHFLSKEGAKVRVSLSIAHPDISAALKQVLEGDANGRVSSAIQGGLRAAEDSCQLRERLSSVHLPRVSR